MEVVILKLFTIGTRQPLEKFHKILMSIFKFNGMKILSK
jgi:hypothetical protein